MTDSINKEKIIDALKDVYDPEIPVNIVDLGLIYELSLIHISEPKRPERI